MRSGPGPETGAVDQACRQLRFEPPRAGGIGSPALDGQRVPAVFHHLWKPLNRGMPTILGKAESVVGSYHCLVEPTTVARATIEAMRFCTGNSSG